jgi:hypothetical protein
MKIVHHKPAARGVSQLMYVGDDAATAAPINLPVTVAIIAVLGWLMFGRKSS